MSELNFGQSSFVKDEDGYLKTKEGNVYGYVRISTTQQNVDRQMVAMEQYGVRPSNIFVEKFSGKNFNRPVYKQMIRMIRRGDIIVIHSLDRLGRNYQEMQDQWRLLTQEIGVGIHVLSMPLLNNSADPEDLLSRFITDLMLQVLSFAAENERTSLLSRQKGGYEAKKYKELQDIDAPWTKHFGRPRKRIPYTFWPIYLQWKGKEKSTKELVRYCEDEFDIPERTVYRQLAELESRFGDFDIETLRNLITDDYEEFGFEYATERTDRRAGIYNKWINNPYYKIKPYKSHRKEVSPEEIKDTGELQKIILEKRQDEFKKKFNSDGSEIKDKGNKRILSDHRILDVSGLGESSLKKSINID